MNDENLRNALLNAEQALSIERGLEKPSDRIQYMLAAFIDLVTGLDEVLHSIDSRLEQIEERLDGLEERAPKAGR
ncbi:hypothetical protein [Burkholderia glumae]|uniref:hypothetical protein n=1 Tax=Burkholderia glumae TaxID=337 RepID=UPI0021645050|nr:hypothetical protein [Burkholderia glumae]UVS95674.1 hypothetical protein EFP19_07750 [Burkholderia glumae]